MGEEQQERFLKLLGENEPLWDCAELKTLALSVGGRWHNLLTRCTLTNQRSREADAIESDTYGLFRKTISLAGVKLLIQQVASGQSDLAGPTVYYGRNIGSDNGLEDYEAGRFYFYDYNHSYSREENRWSHWDFTRSGDQIQKLMEVAGIDRDSLNNEIRTHAQPFDGLDGIARFGVGFQREIESSDHYSQFRVVPQIEARLNVEECALREGTATVNIWAATKEITYVCSIGVFAWNQQEQSHTGSLKIDVDEWEVSGNGFAYTGSYPVSANLSSATLFLRVMSQVIQSHTVLDWSSTGITPTLSAYDSFDPDLKRLKRCFSLTDQKSSKFESAVATLMSFLGFEVLPLYVAPSQNVDVVAYDTSRRVLLAIECTGGEISNSGKLGNLAMRANDIRNAERFSQFDVIAVVATSKEDLAISKAGKDAAKADNISVLARQDLHTLLEMARSDDAARRAIEYIRNRIRHVDFG